VAAVPRMPDAEGVTDPEPLPGRDRFRSLDSLANTGVAAAYQTMLFTLRRLVVGRRVAVRVDEGLLTLTITRLRSRLDLRGLSIAQVNDVRLAARDVRWQGHRLEHASVVLRNVRIRPSVPPVLVAAPVELTVEVPAPALDDLLRWAAPRLSGDIGPDGVARLHLAKRRGSGHVEVDARLDGATLWVTPRAVVRRKRWALPARTPSYRVRLPDLPHGLELTSIEFAPGLVRLTGMLSEWRMDVPRSLFAPTDRHH
jgi:LmeA-like phospholipid-binding